MARKGKKKPTKAEQDASKIFDEMRTYEFAEELYRKEYTKLRSLLNKRIKRSKSMGYQENMGYFPKLKDIPNRQAFALELSQARAYYENKLSTSAGRKAVEEKMIEKLHEHKFTAIDKTNFKPFREFMSALDEKYTIKDASGRKKKLYGSDDAVEWFENLDEETLDSYSPDELVEMFDAWRGVTGN